MYYMDECCYAECLPKPDKVRAGLFISGYEATENVVALKQLNITHILDLRGGKELFPEDFKYMIATDIVDSPSQDLLHLFPTCCDFISEGIESGGVLVHCAAGVSRSATVVCAYLMQKDNITAEQAIGLLRRSRPCVCPNFGFRQQLKLWYQMNFNIYGNSKAHKRYKLLQLSLHFEQHKSVPSDSFHKYISDINQEHHQSYPERYMCYNCKYYLFNSNHVMDHEKCFDQCGVTFNNRTCDGYYIEPLSWMSLNTTAYHKPNEIVCPNDLCRTVLGVWYLGKMDCSCGTQVRPSFKIHKSKVTSDQTGDTLVTTELCSSSSCCTSKSDVQCIGIVK